MIARLFNQIVATLGLAPGARGLRRLAVTAGMAALSLLFAAPALADQVALRPELDAQAGRVTLGDLFQDAGPARDVVVALGGEAGGSLILDAGQVQSVAAAHGLQWSNSAGVRRLIVRVDAEASGRAGRVRPAEVLALARDLKAGEAIEPEDLVWTQAPPFAPQGLPRDPREIIGQAPRRPMQAGAVVSLSDLSTPLAIRKDDVVQVAYAAGGIRLVLEGKAQSSASVGQAVDILNPASKKVIQATASGPDQAVVGPQADTLKTVSPKLVASLR